MIFCQPIWLEYGHPEGTKPVYLFNLPVDLAEPCCILRLISVLLPQLAIFHKHILDGWVKACNHCWKKELMLSCEPSGSGLCMKDGILCWENRSGNKLQRNWDMDGIRDAAFQRHCSRVFSFTWWLWSRFPECRLLSYPLPRGNEWPWIPAQAVALSTCSPSNWLRPEFKDES